LVAFVHVPETVLVTVAMRYPIEMEQSVPSEVFVIAVNPELTVGLVTLPSRNAQIRITSPILWAGIVTVVALAEL
jgi:hypothetical protein